jgi:DNA-directed RNA polymerase I subunit RPA43
VRTSIKYHLRGSSKLSEGRINLCSPDHISLLVHRTFNVSILHQHLPFEEYEFEYGPVENDPEFGVRVASEATPPGLGMEEDQGVRDPGRWVHRKSGVPLGGIERAIEFTIIGCVESSDSECSHRWESATARSSVSHVPRQRLIVAHL